MGLTAGIVVVVTAASSDAVLPQPSRDLTARELNGQNIYRRVCVPCHGRNGDGKGPASQALNPRPRDFTSGLFKFGSTSGGVQPLDADLVRTVSEGVPGTWMPAWKYHLGRDEIISVVSYIKRFSDVFEEEIFEEDVLLKSTNRPAEYKATLESVADGRKLYLKNQCVECHGQHGRGDGPSAGTHDDSWGRPILPTNLRSGVFRGGASEEDIFRTLTTGLGGTPMPAYGEVVSEEDRWRLTDYIVSLRSSSSRWKSYILSRPTWEDPMQGRR